MGRSFVVALLLGTLALAPGLAGAEEEGASLEQVVVEMAHTKAEHQALANYYADKAAAARKLAARHHSMHRAYVGGKGMNKQAFVNHCKRIAEQQGIDSEVHIGFAGSQGEVYAASRFLSDSNGLIPGTLITGGPCNISPIVDCVVAQGNLCLDCVDSPNPMTICETP